MADQVRKWLEGCSRILEFPWEDQEWDRDVEEENRDSCRKVDEFLLVDPTLGKDNSEDCVRTGAKNGDGSITIRWKLDLKCRILMNLIHVNLFDTHYM